MMQQISAQMEIIMYRLLELPKLSKINHSEIDVYRRESEMVKDCITHHIYMFTIEEKLNNLFGFMVFVQFFGTTLNLCAVVYQLSKKSLNNVKFWSETGILICYILQIFMYCWSGDEMMTKSLGIVDAVYIMDWTLLTEETKKNLILMMVRASRPIQLNGATMITMSIATFLKILKASYSAFNLLRSL
ncbi:odorant receptor Or2-like [Belonocnema kinseyi]|uniref:odorant receptor Or2-like n=1 Tax=Belonocnema kinseyi TaxID=2817044 RepID=UPI00143D3B00|nr:odorant receptor Or2-like [Belonocnema kinseyi]